MKVFSVIRTEVIQQQLIDSLKHHTATVAFDREYVAINTFTQPCFFRNTIVTLYVCKDTHKPQGLVLTEDQFMAMFLIPEESYIDYLFECLKDYRRQIQ